MASSSSRRSSVVTSVLAALLAVAAFLFTHADAAAYPCTSNTYRDSYTSLPAAATFPSTKLSDDKIPSREVTKDHWSEVAKIGDFRPEKVTPESNPAQTGCPHKVSGLFDWHNPATWPGGSVPANGASVTIPAGKSVLISSCSVDPTAVFGTITVPDTAKLVFGDAAISFAAKGFDVQVGGELLIGSPTCRLRNKITITLHGSRNAQAVPAPPPVKGIAVQGHVDIHGMLFTRTWSRLAMTAATGDKIIFIQDMVNWQPGQEIFITTTEIKDSRDWHRNEVKTIVKVYKTNLDDNIAAIELDSPLEYLHYGGREYQAEVGLLSRNIKIQGDPTNSDPTDTANNGVCTDSGDGSTYPCTDKYLTGFGGHVQVINPQASGRFSGVELFRMGQTNALGRYPLHFHLIGTTSPSVNYATDCSVHQSYYRCYTIHGTHGVRLSENTAYDAIGNCFYLSEAGVEENNTVTYNLGAHVHPIGDIAGPSLGTSGDGFWGQYLSYFTESVNLHIPADMSAAPFYITNMYSTFEGNAASGGWTGFSFPSLPTPIQEFKDRTDFNPANRPFKTPFQGNSAHSSGFWWASAGVFYFGGELKYDGSGKLTYTEGRSPTVHDTCSNPTSGTPSGDGGCWDITEQRWLNIQHNKAFLGNRALQAWGNRANIQHFEVHDTALSMNVFGKVWISDMLMNCRSRHTTAWFSGCPTATAEPQVPRYDACNIRDFYWFTTIGGFQWYDVGQSHILQDTTFRNCRADWSRCVYGSGGQGECTNSAIFTSLTHSDQFVPQLMQTTSGIKYENSGDKLWKSSTALTAPTGNTVSGKMQSWLDHDGSASRTGERTMIGSDWANEWWRMHDSCEVYLERQVCPMDRKDSSAAIKLHFDASWESQIGGAICINGKRQDGTPDCPIVAKATHFGREEAVGVDVAVMGQLTGPIIYRSGGWFIRYTDGTPSTFTIGDVQVAPEDSLVLALPYPAGTTFDIHYQAASWCGSWAICSHNVTAVGSVEEVAEGFGDTYYWDNDARTLYVRVVMVPDTFGDPRNGDKPWTKVPDAVDVFSRGGLTLQLLRGAPTFVIEATNCGAARCSPQTDVAVPQELRSDYDGDGGDGDAAATLRSQLLSLREKIVVF